MDQICERCGAMDGFTPDDHPCLENLQKQADELWKKYNPGGLADTSGFSDQKIFAWERDTSVIYEHIQALTEWYSKRADEAKQAEDVAYAVKQKARKGLREMRALARERLVDPD